MTPEEFFNGVPPTIVESAPGRVNLLGEHTDYNDGFVLPTATAQRTWVALSASQDGLCRMYSATLDESACFALSKSAPAGFARYVEGCMRMLQERGIALPAVHLYISSQVPIGSGLSSSAALEVAVLRALRSLLGLRLDDLSVALFAQEAETRYADVRCGIMDQMASSLADSSHMLFLDTRTLERRLLPLPPDAELVVIDCGIARSLANSKYNERRAECEEAARRLGVAALRDVQDMTLVERLPDPYRARARHVVAENQRVMQASAGVSAQCFGALMNASHASLRDDFQVSIAALDVLSSVLRGHPEVYGARLTGAGFGGACVALCRNGTAQRVARESLVRYQADPLTGSAQGTILMPRPEQETRVADPFAAFFPLTAHGAPTR